MEEVVEAHHIEHTTQKARKIVEAKVKKEAKKMEACRRRQKKVIGVSLATPGQSTSRRCSSFEKY